MSKKNILTFDFLYSEYILNKKSAIEIGRELHIDKTTIFKYLHKFKIPVRTKKELYFLKFDLSGRKFDKLYVIGFHDFKIRSRWKCKCDCGKEVIRYRETLLNNKKQSCGCNYRTSFQEISGSYWRILQYHAKMRNIFFNLSIEYIWDLFLKQSRKCALSGIEIFFPLKKRDRQTQTASLDRINSSDGYTEGNVQWVHKELNKLKMDMDENLFFNWIKLIYENKQLDKNNTLLFLRNKI